MLGWSVLLIGLFPVIAALPPQEESPVNYDRRSVAGSQAPNRGAAVAAIRAQIQDVVVDFHPVIGSPRWVRATDGFLTGAQGAGRGVSASALAGIPANDPHRGLKAFLNEHSQLFGYGAEALAAARIQRQFVTAHNGLQTVVWEQAVDGIPVFEGLLTAHTTRNGELVSVASGFMPDATGAAARGNPNRERLLSNPAISGATAVALAAREIGEAIGPEAVSAVEAAAAGVEKRQHFRATPLAGDAEAHLVWLPVSDSSMRLCWEIILTRRVRGEMFRVLIDAESGSAMVRHCLTEYITNATYRVFTSDSPSPFSPGHSSPSSVQPSLVLRSVVTLSALSTNASPLGWLDDGANETRGNNVDAHTDIDANNSPDLPRPQGSPSRVFDFPLNLFVAPSVSTNAAVTQLFYWNNFMHDKLYELGFTEAAGNFQSNNFGRGGIGNDAVQADAQDGSGINNANFSTPPDGSPGRMQMYVFTDPGPDRDGSLDAEIVLHEYTHGLSNRRVGAGVGISALQSRGMGEGWSDFYGLALLSEAGDDVNGVYAAGGYATYLLGGLTENYYYGIRRYPYCTDTNKNPLTFRDIDPTQASAHPGVPRSPIIGNSANEVHNMGEVWCVTLWDARANLINKHGWVVGNQLILQLLTDGMNLSPANPNFLQSRDAILQADQINNGGSNQIELWRAFAKRGMGVGATSPSSGSTVGVHESYAAPGVLVNFSWNSFATLQLVAQPFAVQVTARDALGNVVTNFTGAVSLSCTATSAPPSIAISPVVSTNFIAGVWTGNIAALQSGFGAVLTANDGSGHSGSSIAFNIVGTNQPPVFLAEPVSQTVVVSNAVSFSAAAAGTPPLTFRWLYQGTNLPGATIDSLTLTNVQFSQAGTYRLAVSNAFGFALSSNAVLNVVPEPPCLPPYSGLVDWWRGNSNALDTVGANDGSLVNGATFTTGKVNRAFSFDGSSSHVLVPHSASLNFTNALTIELWYKDTGSPTVTASGLVAKRSISSTPASNFVINIRPDGSGSGDLNVYFFDSAFGSFRESHSTLPSAGVFHHLAVTYLQVDSNSVEIKTYIDGVLTKTDSLPGRLSRSTNSVPVVIGCTHPVGGEFFKGIIDEVSLYARALATSEIAAIYSAGTGGKCNSPVPPYILSQPAGQSVLAGTNVTFNVVPAGTPPFSYQWTKDASGIPGATNASYSIVDVQTNHAGTYGVIVTNPGGVAVSSNALLTVIQQPPQILAQPYNTNATIGATASFSVSADGSPPLFYFWRKDTTNVSGATNATFLLTNIQTNAAGVYSVMVSNSYGTLISSNATLIVLTNDCTSIPADLANWWRGEADAFDSIGTNHGTLVNGAIVTSAMAGQGFSFNGSGAHVLVPHSTSLNFTNALTIELWYKDTGSSTSSASGLIAKRDVNSPLASNFGINIRPNGSGGGDLNVYFFDTAFFTFRESHSTLPSAGVFHHLAVTYRQAESTSVEIKTYIDGVLITTDTLPGLLSRSTNSVPVVIGCTHPVGGEFFKGIIDEVSLYARALAPSEIAAIYNANFSGKCRVPPMFVIQPTGETVRLGTNVTLRSFAIGSEVLRYQWRKDGAVLVDDSRISGSTSTNLTILNLLSSDTGLYSISVTNAFGSATTNAMLRVNTTDHFAWSAISSPRFVNVPFLVSIVAQDSVNQLATNFTDTTALSSVNGVFVNPILSGNFVQGSWTGTVLIAQTFSNLILRADDSLGHSGFANPIDIVSIPSVAMSARSNVLVMSWPSYVPLWNLETATNLSPPAWSTLPASPILTNGRYLLEIGNSGTNRFYRLRFPYP